MNINSFKYCLRQSAVSFRRNFWLAVVTSCIIAVSLAILGGFLLLAVNAGQFMRDVESNVEISVFLQEGVSTAAIQTQLASLDNVESVRFVSKAEGLEEFSRSLGDTALLEGLQGENNPLPDSFRVQAADAESVVTLAEAIRTIDGVEMAEYGEELVGKIVNITGWLNTLFVSTSTLLALGAIFLIVTTIRLSVMARLEEIGIMKYLGASDWYIRFPFLLEGMAMGWLGTLTSTSALIFAYTRLALYLQRDTLAFFVRPVTSTQQLAPIFIGLLVLGTCMGGIGSIISVRKFLRV